MTSAASDTRGNVMTSIDDSDSNTAQVGVTAASMDLSGRQYLLIAIGDAPAPPPRSTSGRVISPPPTRQWRCTACPTVRVSRT